MRSSHAERLRALIAQDILSFKLKPGEKLDESRLADKYGTSRTPVREALATAVFGWLDPNPA